jgi:dienelactone hydrolase
MRPRPRSPRTHAPVARGALLALVAASACVQPPRLVVSDAERVLASTTLDALNPGLPGPYRVAHFRYGSGTDRRRAAFRDSVAVRTRPVNGTPFLRGIDAKALKARWRYWGFDAAALPRNGRVWHPDTAGTFPLVLMVHGNHNMKEFSDPGYEWIGRHLASHGYIAVSVDENFLNGGIRSENDARGWMLLQHLALWRAWAGDPAFPLAGRIDTARIALMGHSRGGEAITVAAAFNRLSHWPDDARIPFRFGFGIRALVAIAPVDGQYLPADRLPPVRGVSYFVMHGSHDADVSSFNGQRTWLRADVSDPGTVKASLYVYRANHGQWNTVWGDNDVGPMGRWLAKRSLLTGEEQRQVGRVFFTGFLALALRGDARYEPMLRDYRTVGGWLPRTQYVSQFAAGGERRAATFEEDIDVTTATGGGTIRAHALTQWREGMLPMRSAGRASFETHVVYLGWSPPRGGPAAPPRPDSAPPAPRDTAWYEVPLPAGAVTATSRVVFSVAQLATVPGALAVGDTLTPRDSAPPAPGAKAPGATGAGRGAPRDGTARNGRARRDTLPADSLRVDFTVELVTADGARAGVPLSAVAALRPPLTVRLYRYGFIERKAAAVGRDHEYALQRVEIPWGRFSAALPGIRPEQVRAVRLRFDRTPEGAIVLDDVGVSPR